MRSFIRTLSMFLIVFFIFLSIGFCQDNNDEAKEHYLKGNIYYQQGKYKESQEEFQKALSLLGENEEVKESNIEPVDLPQAAKETAKPEVGAKYSSELSPRGEYVIGDEDDLHILVWQNEDLNTDATVRPDGKISFPLIGEVEATGLTIPELNQAIAEKLKEYIRTPIVSVSLKKIGGKKIVILGEVSTPGVYSLAGRKTLIEAIAMAGGFNQNAVASSVLLIRGGLSSPKGMRLNLSRALTKADMSQNVVLQYEDIIFVPKKFIANVNYFMTQVLGPLVQGASSATSVQGFQSRRSSQ
jgi:polysaccharide biosynthesis/export protein